MENERQHRVQNIRDLLTKEQAMAFDEWAKDDTGANLHLDGIAKTVEKLPDKLTTEQAMDFVLKAKDAILHSEENLGLSKEVEEAISKANAERLAEKIIPLATKIALTEQNNGVEPTDEEVVKFIDDNFGGIKDINTKSTISSSFPDPHPVGGGGSSSSGNASSNKASAQPKVLTKLCPDGVTVGYDNWFLLRDAVTEANNYAAEEFIRCSEYLANNNKSTDDDPPVYTPPEPFVICPGIVLNQKSPYRSIFSPLYWAEYAWSGFIMTLEYMSLLPSTTHAKYVTRRAPPASKMKNKLSPIFINAEDITIECDMCSVDLPGTHFAFGPHAKNVKIRGMTFRGATTSSLQFHHHGAEVSLFDCYWLYNSGGVVSSSRNGPHANVNGNDRVLFDSSTTTAGAVADLNSTSTVTFFRCVIDDVKQNPKSTMTGAGLANVPGMNPPAGHHAGGNQNQPINGAVSSSLTIRN